MKIFLRYLYDNIVPIIVFIITVTVFMFVFTLYNIGTEAVLYASAVSGLVMLTALLVRFFIYAARYRYLRRLLDDLGCKAEPLPEPHGAIEARYNEVIELLREKLTDSESSAARSRTEMLDYFTTWVHQIKIPISVMRMELEAQDTDEYRELSGELFRIEQYVEMVLCYFRLDDGGRDLVISETELDPVIRANVRKYASVFIRSRIRLIYEGTDCKAFTDSKWLSHIIGQLLSNAVKYTRQGSVTVTAENGSITVTDTGIGIAPDDLPRIFERGYTGHNGRTENRSTGIGLYLAKKAADRIGAKLSVTSEVGKGTSVTVAMPTERISE